MNDEFETLIGLVSQYSPSGQERGAVEWLVARMKALGFDDAFVDEAGNAVGVMGKGTKQVVLLGHIDTVPGEISVRVEDAPLPCMAAGRWMRKGRWRVLWMRWQRSARRMAGSLL
ncbi:hypothetical protein [Candidatus Villigracilis affinis]|uniref:hypothetical protein n=1 Tax=Candidatus Villigracilis affinis TaxID=3140682 RepID=UPI001D2A544F|nr:hypothetical protein [Anaerolineales bacterium]